MRAVLLICGATFAWSLIAGAQGVHLTAGNSISVDFNGVNRCVPCPECIAGFSYMDLFFGTDILNPGESVRLEMFENSLTEAPLAITTQSPSDARSWITVFSPSAAWQDFQGVVRATMLNGEVDISYAHFWVGPDRQFAACDAVVPVPEPSVALLALFAGVIGGALNVWRQRRTRAAHQ